MLQCIFFKSNAIFVTICWVAAFVSVQSVERHAFFFYFFFWETCFLILVFIRRPPDRQIMNKWGRKKSSCLLYNPNSTCRCSGGVGKSFCNHCSQDKYSPEPSRNAKSGGEQLEETQDICMSLSMSLKRKKKKKSVFINEWDFFFHLLSVVMFFHSKNT